MVKTMKIQIVPCLLVFLAFLVAGVSASISTAELTVTNYSLEPAYLFTGDTGQVTVVIENSGDEIVDILSADLEAPESAVGFKVLNDLTYDSVGSIGPGDKRSFTFTFRADVPEGVYYPKFYLDLGTDGSFRQYIPVEVKNTELNAAVSDVPDSFNEDVQSEVKITIGNPRQGTVNGVTVTAVGDDVSVTPKSAFIGTLATDGSKEVTFTVTPLKETTVKFVVTYRNGMNDHSTTVLLPVTFSEDKRGAETVLNNVEIESGSGYNTISGDINNAGLTSAYSVTVSVGSPATAVDPNKIYVIGELEPDDFASFEVTYTSSGSTVPVVVTYKDADGNAFTKTYEVDLNSASGFVISGGSGSSGSSSSSGSGAPSGGPGGSRGGMSMFGMMGGGMGGGASIPFLQIGIVLAVILVIVIVAWKKGYIRKLKERIPRRKQSEDDDDKPDR